MTQGPDARRRRSLAWALLVLSLGALVAGLAAGSDGWSLSALWQLGTSPDGELILGRIRAPRSVGAWLVGARFGLAGARSWLATSPGRYHIHNSAMAHKRRLGRRLVLMDAIRIRIWPRR